MPVLTKLAINLGRFAAASHQTAASSIRGAFQSGGAASGATSTGAGSTSGWAGGLSSAGGSAGAGAGGAKYHAGRGAYSTYTGSGRGLIQANVSSTDGSNSRTDDEEERRQAAASSSTRSSNLRGTGSGRRTIVTSNGQLSGLEMRNRFSHAFSTTRGQMLITSSAIEPEAQDHATATSSTSPTSLRQARRNSTSAVEGVSSTTTPNDSVPLPVQDSSESEPFPIGNDDQSSPKPSSLKKLPMYSQLMDVQQSKDEVSARSLVRKFRALDSSQQATASYNAALEALLSVRRKGQDVNSLTDTYVEMIEKNIIPNNRTFSVLVRALCQRDSEVQELKQQSQERGYASSTDQVKNEESQSLSTSENADLSQTGASSGDDSFAQALQLMGVAHNSRQWFSSAEPYNALLKSCAYRGNAEQAISILGYLEKSNFTAPNAQTFKHLIDTFSNGGAQEGETEAQTNERKLEACNQVFKGWEEIRESVTKSGHSNLDADRSVWNSFIGAHFKLGDESGGVAILERMLAGLSSSEESTSTSTSTIPTPDAATFSIIISFFLQASDIESALAWFFKLNELRRTSVEMMLPLPDSTTLVNLIHNLSRDVQTESKVDLEKIKALNHVLSAFYDQAAESLALGQEDSSARPAFLGFSAFNPSISKLCSVAKFHLEDSSASPESTQMANAFLDDVLAHIEFQYRLFADKVHSQGSRDSRRNVVALAGVARTLNDASRPADAGAVLSYAVFALPQASNEKDESELRRGQSIIANTVDAILGIENLDRSSLEDPATLASALEQLQKAPAVPASVLLHVGITSLHEVQLSLGELAILPNLYSYRIAALYRLAREEVNGSVEDLGLDAAGFNKISRALAREEKFLRPENLEAIKKDGLGMLMEDAMKVEKSLDNGKTFLDPSIIASALSSKYGQEKAAEAIETYSPSFARSLRSSEGSSVGSSVAQSISGSEHGVAQSVDGSGYAFTDTVSTPPLSPIYKSMPPLQEVPDFEPLPPAGPSVEEMQAQMQAQTSSQPQAWPMPAPAAPLPNDLPPVQVIDTDLGRTLENLVSTRRGNQPNPEAAYSQLVAAVEVGTYPSPQSIVALMNSFGRSRDVARVQYLYAIASRGVAGLVGNPSWQSNAWTSVEDGMICALAHAGEGEMASVHRHRLIAGGRVPTANAYAALIATVKDTTDDALIAQELFDESQRLGCRPNTYLFNTVISKLSRARKAERALQLFDLMTSPELNLNPTSVTYGAVINAYTRTGDEDSAVRLFEKMEQDRGFKPRVPPYNTMIQFFTSTKPDRAKAERFVEKMRKWRVEPSAHTYKLFLDLYGNMEPVMPQQVSSVFSQLLADPNVQVQGTHWASLITSAGIHQSNLEEAVSIFESIPTHPSTPLDRATGLPSFPDAVSFEALLSVFIHHSRSDLMKSWIQKTRQGSSDSPIVLHPTAYIANHLIRGYSIEEAREVFEEMIDAQAGRAAAGNHLPRQHGAGAGVADVATTPVSTGGKHGFGGIYREPSTYESMIQAELVAGEVQRAQELLSRMEMRAYPPNLILKARSLLESRL